MFFKCQGKMRTGSLYWVLFLLLAITLSACQMLLGQSTDEASGSLVVYSGRQDKLVQPIIDQFAAASGIDVQVKYGKTAEIAATLLEEGENFVYQPDAPPLKEGELLILFEGSSWVPRWISLYKQCN